MKTFSKMLSVPKWLSIGFLCLVAATLGIVGCETAQVLTQPDIQHEQDVSIERIHVSALTEFVPNPDQPDKAQLKVLLELSGAFDSPVPMPCILRFELYEFRPISSDPRGKRLVIWPEKDLTDTGEANKHWKALLRGYEFYLPLDFMPGSDKKYVLEATCFAGQKRYNDLFKMEILPAKD
jgi:hypothetical protein